MFSGVSQASERPACISEMRSQRSASFMKCVVTKIVTLSRRDSSMIISQKTSRATGSTPEVGSSRITILGLWMTAAASERRCFTPSGRADGRVSATSMSPKRLIISSTFRVTASPSSR